MLIFFFITSLKIDIKEIHQSLTEEREQQKSCCFNTQAHITNFLQVKHEYTKRSTFFSNKSNNTFRYILQNTAIGIIYISFEKETMITLLIISA